MNVSETYVVEQLSLKFFPFSSFSSRCSVDKLPREDWKNNWNLWQTRILLVAAFVSVSSENQFQWFQIKRHSKPRRCDGISPFIHCSSSENGCASLLVSFPLPTVSSENPYSRRRMRRPVQAMLLPLRSPDFLSFRGKSSNLLLPRNRLGSAIMLATLSEPLLLSIPSRVVRCEQQNGPARHRTRLNAQSNVSP